MNHSLSRQARSAKKRGAHSGSRSREALVPYLFIAPFVVMFLVFFLIPAVYSLYISFCNYAGFGPMTFLGLSNFKAIFHFNFFWKAIGNTLFYYIWHTIPVMVLSFLLAVILSSRSVRYKRFFKVSIFLPVTMSSVAATLIWKVILGTRSGAINTFLGTSIPFIDSSTLFRWSVVIILVWKSVGWFMMVYMSGLTTIDHEIYEAAKVDGAGPLRSMTLITIPLMKPIFMFAFLIDTMSSLKLFTEPRLLAATGSVAPVTNTIVGILVDYMNAGRFGMASAVGWALFIMISGLSVIQFMAFTKRSKTDV